MGHLLLSEEYEPRDVLGQLEAMAQDANLLAQEID